MRSTHLLRLFGGWRSSAPAGIDLSGDATSAEAQTWADVVEPPAPPIPGFQRPKLSLQPGDIALCVADPHGRLMRIEFQQASGEPLKYDRNGWAHSGGAGGARFDIYRIGPALLNSTRLVIWLNTSKTRVKVPFTLKNVPIR